MRTGAISMATPAIVLAVACTGLNPAFDLSSGGGDGSGSTSIPMDEATTGSTGSTSSGDASTESGSLSTAAGESSTGEDSTTGTPAPIVRCRGAFWGVSAIAEDAPAGVLLAISIAEDHQGIVRHREIPRSYAVATDPMTGALYLADTNALSPLTTLNPFDDSTIDTIELSIEGGSVTAPWGRADIDEAGELWLSSSVGGAPWRLTVGSATLSPVPVGGENMGYFGDLTFTSDGHVYVLAADASGETQYVLVLNRSDEGVTVAAQISFTRPEGIQSRVAGIVSVSDDSLWVSTDGGLNNGMPAVGAGVFELRVRESGGGVPALEVGASIPSELPINDLAPMFAPEGHCPTP